MKFFATFLLVLSFNIIAQENFAELRLGIEDNYRKVVEHSVNGTLQGNFKGQNYGIRFGRTFGPSQVYFEYNPKQDVEIKSKDELAKVKSYFLGYRYFFPSQFFIGGQIGHSSFELKQGPNGVTFADNPMTEGMTYGINLGHKYMLSNKFYLAGDFVYNLGNYKEDGPNSNAVDSIEVKYQSQINLNIGFSF